MHIQYVLVEYRFYFFSIVVLFALLVYNSYEILSLDKELVRIEKELQMNQATFERKQKVYDEKAKQQQAQLERWIKEIKLKK